MNWDHWMREPKQHRGREVLFPQVPRAFHHGAEGTFMTPDTHEKYFRHIAVNRNASVTWALPIFGEEDVAVAGSAAEQYEQYITEKLRTARTLTNVKQVEHALAAGHPEVLAICFFFCIVLTSSGDDTPGHL